MCGRFALDVHGDSVFSSFDWLDRHRSETKPETQRLELPETWAPARNIAPTDQALVIGARPGMAPTLRKMSWGLDGVSSAKARKHINARVESLDQRTVFQRAYQRGRCLVPASGYYEWFDAGDGKEPYYAQDASGQLLLMAGLYQRNADPRGADPKAGGTFGFVIVTQPSAGTAAHYHDRMPLLVPQGSWRHWLEVAEPRARLRAIPANLQWTQRDPKAE